MHTADGGASWQTQYSGAAYHGAFFDIDFADDTHGWAAGLTADWPVGHPMVARTTNGGASWSFVPLPGATGSPRAISFVDALHGWAITSLTSAWPSQIYVTVDGGLTWTLQYSTSAVLSDITFVDALHGWATGGGNGLAVLSTTDGGASWNTQQVPIAYVQAGQHVTFIDRLHGWVACGPLIQATADGGQTWWTERPGSMVQSVAFTDPDHGWAATLTGDWTYGQGGILRTTTGGFVPGPVTTVSGAPSQWQRRPVRLTFSAQDPPGGAGMSGGPAKTEFKLDNGPWTAGTALTVPAAANHADDGVHWVMFRSTDAAGITEPARTLTVKIDTTGPTTSARKLNGRLRVPMQLQYRVSDRASIGTSSLHVVLRTAAGKLVHIFKKSAVPTGIWNTLNWTPRARGTCRYYVYAADQAGNRQRNVARGTVVVR
jgi:photosystem II stability/assembly factor-like uncharacterized protein